MVRFADSRQPDRVYDKERGSFQSFAPRPLCGGIERGSAAIGAVIRPARARAQTLGSCSLKESVPFCGHGEYRSNSRERVNQVTRFRIVSLEPR